MGSCSKRNKVKVLISRDKQHFGDCNHLLVESARKMLNSSPVPCHEIVVNRMLGDVAEQERVGLTFNRSVTESIDDRWRDLEILNTRFLQDVINMEEQIKDDIHKCEKQMASFVVNRTQVITLRSKIEQMAGLAMHIYFYKSVLERKIGSLEGTAHFLQKCTEMMGFNQPAQIIDRHAALKGIFEEIFSEYEARAVQLNKLQEQYAALVETTIRENMVRHNKMANMYERLKQVKNESAETERFIQHNLEISSTAAVLLYNIKNSISQIYIKMMQQRGQEPVETEALEQLAEIETRMRLIEHVARSVHEQMTFESMAKKEPKPPVERKRRRRRRSLRKAESRETEPSTYSTVTEGETEEVEEESADTLDEFAHILELFNEIGDMTDTDVIHMPTHSRTNLRKDRKVPDEHVERRSMRLDQMKRITKASMEHDQSVREALARYHQAEQEREPSASRVTSARSSIGRSSSLFSGTSERRLSLSSVRSLSSHRHHLGHVSGETLHLERLTEERPDKLATPKQSQRSVLAHPTARSTVSVHVKESLKFADANENKRKSNIARSQSGIEPFSESFKVRKARSFGKDATNNKGNSASSRCNAGYLRKRGGRANSLCVKSTPGGGYSKQRSPLPQLKATDRSLSVDAKHKSIHDLDRGESGALPVLRRKKHTSLPRLSKSQRFGPLATITENGNYQQSERALKANNSASISSREKSADCANPPKTQEQRKPGDSVDSQNKSFNHKETSQGDAKASLSKCSHRVDSDASTYQIQDLPTENSKSGPAEGETSDRIVLSKSSSHNFTKDFACTKTNRETRQNSIYLDGKTVPSTFNKKGQSSSLQRQDQSGSALFGQLHGTQNFDQSNAIGETEPLTSTDSTGPPGNLKCRGDALVPPPLKKDAENKTTSLERRIARGLELAHQQRISLLRRQHATTMKRLAFKSDKIKTNDYKISRKSQQQKLRDKLQSCLPSLQVAKDTVEEPTESEPRDAVPEICPDPGSHQSRLRSAGNVTTDSSKPQMGRTVRRYSLNDNNSFGQLPQLRKSLASAAKPPGAQSSECPRSCATKDSRRLLGELCAERRRLRSNCLAFLAGVNLHPARSQAVEGEEEEE